MRGVFLKFCIIQILYNSRRAHGKPGPLEALPGLRALVVSVYIIIYYINKAQKQEAQKGARGCFSSQKTRAETRKHLYTSQPESVPKRRLWVEYWMEFESDEKMTLT